MTEKLVSALLLFNVYIGASLAIRIEIAPPTYTEDSRGPVNISCIPSASDVTGVGDIYLMEIKRNDEKPLVYLRVTNGLAYSTEAFKPAQMHADGTIDTDVSKTYLRLTISDPGDDDGGLYTCHMFFSDDTGYINERRASGNLTVEKYDVHVLVKGLLDKIDALENEVKTLSNKGPFTTMFSAGLKDRLQVSVGNTIVYPDVIVGHGQGYDNNTGIFTVPVAGVYGFHLSALLSCTGCSMELCIKKDGEVVGCVEVGSNTHWDHASISPVAELKQGDRVKVLASIVNPTLSTLWGGKINFFTGYLIKGF